MVTWNSRLLDELIAPGFSSLTVAEIPDIEGEFPQAEYWLANHFLNTVLRSRFDDGYRQVVVGFLRRAQNAHQAYKESRSLTLRFLARSGSQNPGLRAYYVAVSRWEDLALQCSMAMDLFKWLNKGDGAFKKNDGSAWNRLHQLANQVKHAAGCVESGQCRPEHTVPLWLSSSGIHSFDIPVSYDETADVVRSLCRLAERLQDPLEFANGARSRSGDTPPEEQEGVPPERK